MASSSGNSSSGSPQIPNSGSIEDLGQAMDQRKRKRMQSNRESARRSRMRKQKHLDELMAQIAQLKKENQQISTSVNVTTQHYVSVEAENSVLRAQMMELSHRLHSLNEISSYCCVIEAAENNNNFGDCLMNNNSWNLMGMMNNQYPITAAAAEMFDY